jgi:LPXTG-motif cell wall-anchored protein
MRKWMIFALIGAVFGDVVTMLVAPAIIAWYNSTVDASAMCNCLTTARSTATRLVQAQGAGSLIGALLFLFVGFLISRRRRKKLSAQMAAAAPPATS